MSATGQRAIERLPIRLRAHIVPKNKREHSRRERYGIAPAMLVFDTETRVDPTQRLLCGCYRYYRRKGRHYVCVEEGLFYDDDLPTLSPSEFTILETYCADHASHAGRGHDQTLQLRTRREFLELFWKAAYVRRALVVCFNSPFDLSRLAIQVASGRGRHRQGFSLTLWEYQDKETGEWKPNPHRPRIRITHLDSKRALIEFSGVRDANKDDLVNGRAYRGRFLDLRTLAFALTGESHSLASACRVFGIPDGKQDVEQHGVITLAYLDYNRHDVHLTWALCKAMLAEFDRHALDLDPEQAYSVASLAKGYLRRMGIQQPSRKFGRLSSELVGWIATTYVGGRAEARIRLTEVPVRYVDFTSMYPTVNALLGTWDLLVASSLKVVDVTEEAQRLLDTFTLAGAFDPALWRRFGFFGQVIPNGDILPVRALYDGRTYSVGLNPLFSRDPLWFTGPDLADSTLLCGRPPRLLRAFRLVPRAQQAKLRPTALRSAVNIDPRVDDLFRVAIEQRQLVRQDLSLPPEERERLQLFLKLVANSGGYGTNAEYNRELLPSGKKAQVLVHGLGEPFPAATIAPEAPGEFAAMFLAALTTGAARLMLGILEACVVEHGGIYACCDTDSLMIVASRRGGLVPCRGGPHQLEDGRAAVRALSWTAVDDIIKRFAGLNPYDQNAVPGSILKLEDLNNGLSGTPEELYCVAVSAKRYALYNLDPHAGVVLRKASEHGLGHVLDPKRVPTAHRDEETASLSWIDEVWSDTIGRVRGQRVTRPTWYRQPAVGQCTVSSPDVLKAFATINQGKAYSDQIKPANFVLTAHVASLGHPDGVDPTRFQLFAPFESNPELWLSTLWQDKYSGKSFHISVGDRHPDHVRVKTIGELVSDHRTHPEAKSLDQHGRPCTRLTKGLLFRRPVEVEEVVYIGKEANALEPVMLGLVHDSAEVVTEYRDPTRDSWSRDVQPFLALLPAPVLARSAHRTKRMAKYYKAGDFRPSPAALRRLMPVLGELARRYLKRKSSPTPVRNAAERLLASPLAQARRVRS